MNGVKLGDQEFEIVAEGVPEIRVEESNGEIVVDGRYTPFDFGSANVGSNGQSMAFEVINHGSADLVIESLAVPTGFQIVNGLPGVLQPGQSDTLVVSLDTSVAGYYAGEVKIETNDASELLHTFSVEGQVETGSPNLILGLSQRDEYEGSVLVGNVRRTGSLNSNLVVNLISTSPDEVSVPANVTIPAGEKFAQFYFNVENDAEFDGVQNAQIIATSLGYDIAVNSIDVISPEFSATNGQVLSGAAIAGDVEATNLSDDQYWILQATQQPTGELKPISIELSTQLRDLNVENLTLQVEAAASNPRLQVFIDAFDFEANQYVQVAVESATTVDSIYSVALPGDMSRFVDPLDGTLQARLSWQPAVRSFGLPWEVRVDHVQWTSTTNPLTSTAPDSANRQVWVGDASNLPENPELYDPHSGIDEARFGFGVDQDGDGQGELAPGFVLFAESKYANQNEFDGEPECPCGCGMRAGQHHIAGNLHVHNLRNGDVQASEQNALHNLISTTDQLFDTGPVNEPSARLQGLDWLVQFGEKDLWVDAGSESVSSGSLSRLETSSKTDRTLDSILGQDRRDASFELKRFEELDFDVLESIS